MEKITSYNEVLREYLYELQAAYEIRRCSFIKCDILGMW